MPKTIYITEKQKKAIAAQDQVKNKVNAGIMDAVCGVCESEPDFYLGTEGGNNDYFHIISEGKENKFDYKPYIKSLLTFFKDKTDLNIYPFPKIILNNEKQEGLFIRTGYYDPNNKEVVLFINDRHEKDVMRSLAHELIHHHQNLSDENAFNNVTGTTLGGNDGLDKFESEAYEKGNMYFRKWTEYEQRKEKKTLNEDISGAVIETWYRGYDSKLGVQRDHLLWVTDDLDYAKEYGDAVMEYKIDMSKCNGCISDFDDYFDYYDGPTKEEAKELLKQGINSYGFYANSEESFCMCLWDKSPIVSERPLNTEQLNEEIDPKVREEKWLRRQAVDIYGITTDFNKAGFILTTGELLDMSNGEEKKSMHHGALDVKGAQMNKFIEVGEIRINADAPGIEFYKKPTEEQYDVINRFFHWAPLEKIYVDCRDTNGDILWSGEYKKNEIEKLRSDIDNGGARQMMGNDVLDGYSITDFLEEEVSPDDVDLSSFNIKHNLNPKFWKDGHLDTRIRTKLLDIAYDFIDYLGIPWVEPEDITMTGSLANYNWDKKFSDVDLHILIDYKDVDDKVDFVKNYFNTIKSKWNEDHGDIKIYGFSVEVYVQDVNEPHASTGVYSIDKDKWLKEPEREKLAKSKVNKKKIREKVSDYMNRIDALYDLYSAHKDNDKNLEQISIAADKIFSEIKNERAKDIKKGEISNGNIIFKALRRNGYIEKISKLKKKSYNILNSL